MNLLNKKTLIFIGIFLALVVFPIEKSFASTSSIIKVNNIEVNITRDLGEEEETYTIDTSAILTSFYLAFDDNNKIELTKGSEASWNVVLIYGGKTYSGNIGQSVSEIKIDDESIAIVQSLRKDSISFSVSKGLADRIFDKILVNRDSFILTANSGDGRNIKVERENIEGEDKYIFSSNEALENVKVIDGTDNIIISYNNSNNNYEVSGQYKGISKSTIVSGKAEMIDYNGIKVGVEIGKERNTIILSSDHETIERVAQMILDDKRNITETTISSGGTFEIPSNSNLSTINTSGNGGGTVKFVDSSSNINKEITVNYSGNKVVFPAGTKITGPDGWTGEMSLPMIKDSPTISFLSGYSVNVSQVITIGDEGNFTFDKPVHLIFNGQAGKRAGFIKKDGSFTEIEACDGTNIPAGKEDCKYDSVSDLIVLTKHFTEFVVFTATPISSGGSGGGGGSIYISDVRADVQSNQVVITFDVSSASPAFLRYRTAQEETYTELTETESKLSHSFTLTGLSSGTTYYYKVGASNETSSEYSFTYIETETQSGGSTIPTPIVVETESQTIKGDLTGDGVVDEYDFSLLMANWGKVGSNISDLNDDGVVDEYDFSLLMANWTI